MMSRLSDLTSAAIGCYMQLKNYLPEIDKILADGKQTALFADWLTRPNQDTCKLLQSLQAETVKLTEPVPDSTTVSDGSKAQPGPVISPKAEA